ncbi:GNAT family protein [Sphingomonas aerolata]|uniref:GNAT family N-acetyltransferase n=1 Tax=Sphingomonas aerolata TaxID=185951 RepID=UPI002FE39E78
MNWRAWAITAAWRRPGDRLGVGRADARAGVTEIGFILARARWGRGLASEAVSAVLDQLFAEGQHRVFADADSENSASILLLERLGFRRERLLRGEWETHMGLRDSLIYGLHADDWLAAALPNPRDAVLERTRLLA